MNELAIKKDTLAVHCKNWMIYYITTTKENFMLALNWQSSFIDLCWTIVNKYEVTYVEPFNPTDIDVAIMKYDIKIRNELLKRQKEKIDRVWRWFDSIKEIENYVNTKILKIKKE